MKREQVFGALQFFYLNASEAVPNLLSYKGGDNFCLRLALCTAYTGRDVLKTEECRHAMITVCTHMEHSSGLVYA